MQSLNENIISLFDERANSLACRAVPAICFVHGDCKKLGLLLFRGTLLSMALVLIALPALLIMFDPLTAKLTKRSFCRDSEEVKK